MTPIEKCRKCGSKDVSIGFHARAKIVNGVSFAMSPVIACRSCKLRFVSTKMTRQYLRQYIIAFPLIECHR